MKLSATVTVAARRRLPALVLALALASAASPAARKKPRAPAPDPLRQRIESVLASPEAARAFLGLEVVSLDTGKTLYAVNEHRFFTPASNTKLFTTALALATLGPQFRFRTTVEAAVPADKYGRIAGDVWLVGRGDANLSSRLLPFKGKTEREGSPLRALDALADQVVQRGIRYVDGDLVADDSYFTFERYGEGWSQDDLVWWYGAPVSALSVNDNVFFLEVLPGEKPGDQALLRLEPFQDYYRIENRVKTVPGAPAAAPGGGASVEPVARRISIHREPGSHTLEIWGRIPEDDKGFRAQVAIEDPAMFAGKYLRDALLQRGVVVYGQVRANHARVSEFEDLKSPAVVAAQGPARTVLAEYLSAPLEEDLKVINKVSQNLHAEMILRAVARERRGIGSVEAGLEEMRAFLVGAGVPEDEFVFFDGSGLSRQNLVTPAAVVALLRYMAGQPFAPTWLQLLPVAGVDGSISERFKQTPAAGRIQAKSGTLGHVNALSGYATTLKGGRLAFSILLNNHNLRASQATALLDRISLAFVEVP